MKKYIFLFVLLSGLYSSGLNAQSYYRWRLGAGVGGTYYSGDLSYKLNTTAVYWPAYRVSLGGYLSPSLGLELSGTWGRITGTDRSENWQGDLQTGNPNFARGYNFETRIRSAHLLLRYQFNNGRFLSEYARLAPYVFAGAGVTAFDVYSDLTNAAGQPYYYWPDNTVRDQPEGGPDAQVITQDGSFETKVSGTEGGPDYPTSVASIPFGAGLQFRLTERLGLDLRTEARYTFSDYLDNASGGQRDWYYLTSLSLHYNFNLRQKKFRAPVAYAGYNQPLSNTPTAANTAGHAKTPTQDTVKVSRLRPRTDVQVPVSRQALPGFRERQTVSTNRVERTGGNRQTVDVNIRVFVEGLDTQGRQIRVETDTASSTRRVTESINTSEVITNTTTDTVYQNITGPSPAPAARRTQPPAPARPVTTDSATVLPVRPAAPAKSPRARQTARTPQRDTVVITPIEQRRTTIIQERTANEQRIRTLGSEMADLNRQLDNSRTPADNTGAARRTEQETERLRSRISTLQSGLEDLRNQNNLLRRQGRDLDRSQTTEDLVRLQTQLNTLRTQTPANQNPALDRKVDSLLRQVNTINTRLRSLSSDTASKPVLGNTVARDTASATASIPPANVTPADTNDYSLAGTYATEDTLVSSLRSQLQQLNQVVATLQNQIAEANNTPAERVRSPYGAVTVYYAVNSAAISAADKQRLSVLADRLKASPTTLLQVKGFTDKTGNAAYNLVLSRRRAETIRNYLVNEKGVRPEQILINYFGQSQAAGATKSPYDRRVELELFVAGQ